MANFPGARRINASTFARRRGLRSFPCEGTEGRDFFSSPRELRRRRRTKYLRARESSAEKRSKLILQTEGGRMWMCIFAMEGGSGNAVVDVWRGFYYIFLGGEGA